MLTFAQKGSQVLLHMMVAFAVTYGFTGSLAVGGIAALVEPICNVLILPLHDRIWLRIRQRLAQSRDQAGNAQSREYTAKPTQKNTFASTATPAARAAGISGAIQPEAA